MESALGTPASLSGLPAPVFFPSCQVLGFLLYFSLVIEPLRDALQVNAVV